MSLKEILDVVDDVNKELNMNQDLNDAIKAKSHELLDSLDGLYLHAAYNLIKLAARTMKTEKETRISNEENQDTYLGLCARCNTPLKAGEYGSTREGYSSRNMCTPCLHEYANARERI